VWPEAVQHHVAARTHALCRGSELAYYNSTPKQRVTCREAVQQHSQAALQASHQEHVS
jgi:hypothetical protein